MKECYAMMVKAGYVQGLKDAAKLLEKVVHMYEWGESDDTIAEELRRQEAELDKMLQG